MFQMLNGRNFFRKLLIFIDGMGTWNILTLSAYYSDGIFDVRKEHKKRLSIPDSQSFVNLKSNTMKNTVQIYGLLSNLQIKQEKRDVL